MATLLKRLEFKQRYPAIHQGLFIAPTEKRLPKGQDDINMSWGPCTPDDFKTKLSQWIDAQTTGRDRSKIRIVVK